MSETDYRAVTYDLTLAVAHTVLAANPALTFCYVSGAGTDAGGRMMWARVKGETENALLALTERAYMFRPGVIVPLPGGKARTKTYVVMYRVVAPLYPLLRRIASDRVTSALQLGQAMIQVSLAGAATRVLSTADINRLAVERTR
jgi:uncharacterized protein YbjT (DUF2867 family)